MDRSISSNAAKLLTKDVQQIRVFLGVNQHTSNRNMMGSLAKLTQIESGVSLTKLDEHVKKVLVHHITTDPNPINSLPTTLDLDERVRRVLHSARPENTRTSSHSSARRDNNTRRKHEAFYQQKQVYNQSRERQREYKNSIVYNTLRYNTRW